MKKSEKSFSQKEGLFLYCDLKTSEELRKRLLASRISCDRGVFQNVGLFNFFPMLEIVEHA
jgi:hypothetical protein